MRPFLSSVLCAFNGVLIALPVTWVLPPIVGIPSMILFAIMGWRIGQKNADSSAFFYFALVCSLILLILIYQAMNHAAVSV